jgi:hypothetical protein
MNAWIVRIQCVRHARRACRVCTSSRATARTFCEIRVAGRAVRAESNSPLDLETQLYCTKRDGGIFSTVIVGGPTTMTVEQIPHPPAVWVPTLMMTLS